MCSSAPVDEKWELDKVIRRGGSTNMITMRLVCECHNEGQKSEEYE